MKEITKKLRSEALKQFAPMVESMAADGHSVNEIVAAFQAYMKCKIYRFYHQKSFISLRETLKSYGDFEKVDSHGEMIFYDMLLSKKINFEFQRVIGPYRVDYLIAGQFIVELDGPLHNTERDARRDKYLKKMGYMIMRVPFWVLIMDCGAVIEEIKIQMQKFPPK